MKKTSKLLSLLLLITSAPSFGFLPDSVIYGQDNRKEVSQITNSRIQKQTNAVAVMVRKNRLRSLDQKRLTYQSVSLGNAMNLCPNERFFAQPALGECTGFIVAPDILVTAGHCATRQSDCNQFKWVFGFNSQNNGIINKDSVYSCKSIVMTSEVSTSKSFEDYAIIKLDRPVAGVKPLKFRKKGKVRAGANLYVIGHPDGIPMKITDGAKVRSFIRLNLNMPEDFFFEKHDFYNNRSDVFAANLDMFAGNSGSPVFNAKTGIVEGILVEGEDDYKFDSNLGCMRPNQISNKKFNAGEIVQRMTKLPRRLLK